MISQRHKAFILALVDEADALTAQKERVDRLIKNYFNEGFDGITVVTADISGDREIAHMEQARISSMITQLQSIQTAMSSGVMDEISKAASIALD